MKHNATFLLLALTALSLAFSSCLRDECTSKRTYIRYDPVYKTLSEIRVAIGSEAPRAMQKPGKLYVFGSFLFINEIREGIHVIDNSDPANPRPVAFWRIPGNVDMAIRGNYLYADQYIDLIALDISDINNPTFVCRQENVFQPMGNDPQRGLLVDYVKTEVTETIDCNDNRFNQPWFWMNDVIFASAEFAGNFSTGGSVPAAVGIGGSYARFTQVGDYLYCVDMSNLRTFSVASPSCPTSVGVQQIGWNIETIFPFGNRLFIGAQNGISIFSLSNPAAPVREGQFTHATACDPVITDGNYAYVTLHDGTPCQGFANQLDVVDVRNLPSMALATVIPMDHPQGLTAAGDFLYVCDDGLKIFDKSAAPTLEQKAHLLQGRQTYDAIALGQSLLLVIGPDGFTQFDISNPVEPVQLSTLAVSR